MPKSFSVKLKNGNKTHILSNLTKDTTIGIFKLRVGLAIIKNVSNLRISIGFPPRLLNLSRNADSIDSIGIKKDVILVLEMKESEQKHKKQVENIEVPAEIRPKKELFCSVKVCAADINSGAIDGRNIGLLVRQPIAGNASSLFMAVRYAMTGKIDANADEEMRHIIAIKLASEPERFNKSILGVSNANYLERILNPTTCGGGVECAILSEHYRAEIDVVHIAEGIVYRFGERSNYARRMFLTLKNTHYDVLYMTHTNSTLRRTLFPINEVGPYEQALKFARKKKWHNKNHKLRFKKDTSYVRSRHSEDKLARLCKQAKAKFDDVETAINQYACIETEDSGSDDDIPLECVMKNNSTERDDTNKFVVRKNNSANTQEIPVKTESSQCNTNVSERFLTKSSTSTQLSIGSFKNEKCAKETEGDPTNKVDVMQVNSANIQEIPAKTECSEYNTNVSERFLMKSSASSQLSIGSFKNEKCAKETEGDPTNKVDVMQVNSANIQEIPAKTECSEYNTNVSERFLMKSSASSQLSIGSFKNEKCAKETEGDPTNKVDVMQVNSANIQEIPAKTECSEYNTNVSERFLMKSSTSSQFSIKSFRNERCAEETERDATNEFNNEVKSNQIKHFKAIVKTYCVSSDSVLCQPVETVGKFKRSRTFT
ncbi:uncharacterized protein LOC119662062 [Teleopsis dalmanni]|uniref:uncharacterized protein LOC119662062 n=1 Tax=Teleopsis dalmanni TaxID=139649 RepID=UPI0018CFAAA1|nr:uncharacterized protein LOC119662062 [Teleopsis dalmanni]